MIVDIWNNILYQPVFNALIFIYNNWTDHSLGWSIVYLTVILRLVLLPLAILHLTRAKRNQELTDEVKELEVQYKNDLVLRKQEIRKVLKNRHVNPWAKALSLGIQGLMLVLLYEVFLGGITGRKMIDLLYSFIDFPGSIDSMFYGISLGARYTLLWPIITAILLFLENYLEIKKKKKKFNKKDLNYLVLFPFSIFVLLWMLPMAKSLFVFTSMIFSIIVNPILAFIFGQKTKKTS